jgi:ribosomal protein S18 acetylase RimI-like enzyme
VAHILRSSTPNIRRLEVPADLHSVADLIDLCFAGTMDEDGLDYLRHIRESASNPGLIRWVPAAGELISFPLHGFVWVEENVVVGNLSLIPFYWQHHWRFLIANVAVHPDYRNRGIGRELTKKAVEHSRTLGHHNVWLHVREGNLPAIRLYESLGFVERCRRATWQNNAPLKVSGTSQNLHVSGRKGSDWADQKKSLSVAYPEEVAWNLNFKVDRFRPGFFSELLNFLNDRETKQWVIRISQQVMGTAIWEPTRQFADNIWLGVPASDQERVIETLLKAIVSSLRGKRPLAVNYPADLAESGFRNAGFHLLHNLLWMEKNLTGKDLF